MHIYCPLLLLFLLNSELGFCEFPIIQKTESPPKIIDITNTIPHISFPLDAVDIVFCMSLPPCPPLKTRPKTISTEMLHVVNIAAIFLIAIQNGLFLLTFPCTIGINIPIPILIA